MNPAIALTLSRIVIAPFFAFFFIRSFEPGAALSWLWIAIALTILIELSDTFDGRVARSRGQVTAFGKLVDPMADSISRQTVFISFMVTGIIPLWMYLIFFYRDSILSTLRIMIAVSGRVQAAKTSGKIKAVVQAIGIALVLAVCLAHAYHFPFVPATVAGRHPGFWIMLIPAIITVLSAFDYVLPSVPIIGQLMIPEKPKR